MTARSEMILAIEWTVSSKIPTRERWFASSSVANSEAASPAELPSSTSKSAKQSSMNR